MPSLIAEKNPSWKGNKAGKVSLHLYIKRRKIKPLLCEHCKEKPATDLANLKNHNYSRNIEDYAWLCHRCHQKMDKTFPNQVYDWNGKKHRPESIEKMKRNRPDISGKNNPFYGKHHTLESKEKNKIAHLGNTIRKGCHLSKETKLKMSLSKKGYVPWNKGKHGIYSEETKRKMVRRPVNA
jgi:hypothetical protein